MALPPQFAKNKAPPFGAGGKAPPFGGKQAPSAAPEDESESESESESASGEEESSSNAPKMAQGSMNPLRKWAEKNKG